MRVEKHLESLREVLDEIESSMEDPRGLQSHQRRLAVMLSLGVTDLVEMYFHKSGIMKQGARLKHSWFKKKDVKKRLGRQITGDLGKITNLDEILDRCRDIENSRNDLAYGSPLEDTKFLKEKIDEFFEIKDIIEDEIGEKIE